MDAKLATSSTTQKPQIDSSTTCPMFDVVSTEYQEQVSAIAMRGTRANAVILPTTLPAAREVSRNMSAHWATKHISAMVATVRPTMTLDNQESTMQMRGTS